MKSFITYEKPLHTKVWILMIDAATTKEKHSFLHPLITRAYFYGLFSFILKYDCFTVLCPFLLHSKVNRLYVYIYPSLLSLPPAPRGRQGARSWAPCAVQLLPTRCLCYTRECIHVHAALPVRLTLSFPRCLHVSSLCLRLYSCPANRFICTGFLDSIYKEHKLYILNTGKEKGPCLTYF